MISDFIEVAAKLAEFSGQLKQANTKKRESIAAYFKTVGECLKNIAQQLREGEVPTTKFGELQVYAEQLSMIITDYVGREEANKLSDWLVKTTNIIRNEAPFIIQEFHDSHNNQGSIQIIEEASGRFSGLAITIGYSASKSKNRSFRILLIVSSAVIIPISLAAIWYLSSILSHQQIVVSTSKPSIPSLSSPCSTLSGIYRGKYKWGVLKINYLTLNTKATNCYFYADDNNENPYFSHLVSGSLKFRIGDRLLWNITIKRTNKNDKCETQMYGTLTSYMKSDDVKISITATDGHCDIDKNHTEISELVRD